MTYQLKDLLARKLMKLVGLTLLTEKQTIAYLKDYSILSKPGSVVTLPTLEDSINSNRIIFNKVEERFDDIHVYEYSSNNKEDTLRPCGALIGGKKIFNTDFHRVDIIKDFSEIVKRKKVNTDILIAPWHHYFGKAFIGYYDYMIYLAAKLCRIKDALTEIDFNNSVISYPLANTSYEQEFLHLIGFSDNRIYDSRLTELKFNKCILANNPDYTYPNISDILSLKKHINIKKSIHVGKRDRIYLSRGGRRKIINEDNLIKMLEKYSFKIVEDKQRTLTEQIAIFNNADFILGPHGAGFTNIIWCEPGTHIFEIFGANYAPNHFQYLSKLMNLQYSAYCRDHIVNTISAATGEDIPVSISDIERYLNKIFEE